MKRNAVTPAGSSARAPRSTTAKGSIRASAAVAGASAHGPRVQRGAKRSLLAAVPGRHYAGEPSAASEPKHAIAAIAGASSRMPPVQREVIRALLVAVPGRHYAGEPLLRYPMLTPPCGLCAFHCCNGGMQPGEWARRAQMRGDYPLDGGFFETMADHEWAATSAENIRSDFLAHLMKFGRQGQVTRLSRPGPQGYPSTDDFNDLADYLKVRFELCNLENADELVTVYGRDNERPIVFRMGFCLVGPSRSAEHYVIVQAWGAGSRVQDVHTGCNPVPRSALAVAVREDIVEVLDSDEGDEHGESSPRGDRSFSPPADIDGDLLEERSGSLSSLLSDENRHWGDVSALVHAPSRKAPSVAQHMVKKEEVKDEEIECVKGCKPAAAPRRSEFTTLCSFEIPSKVPNKPDASLADRIRAGAQEALLRASFGDSQVHGIYPHFTNYQKVAYEMRKVNSCRWECVSCVPKCGLAGRALQTSATTGLLQYLTSTSTDAHAQPQEHRAVKGATPEQWKVLLQHRDQVFTRAGMISRFGATGIPKPSNAIIDGFLRVDPGASVAALQQSSVSRGALEAFLSARSYDKLVRQTEGLPMNKLYVIARVLKKKDEDDGEDTWDDWMVAFCCEAWWNQFTKLADYFIGMIDATHGMTARGQGEARASIEIAHTFWGFCNVHYAPGRQNKRSRLMRFRQSFNELTMVSSFTESGASASFAIDSFSRFACRRRPDLYARWLGPGKPLAVIMDFAAGPMGAVKEIFSAQLCEYERSHEGRLHVRHDQTILLNCLDHCIRNALESGQKDGGWSKLVGDRQCAAEALKRHVVFSALKLPIVLFDIFYFYNLDQVATERVEYGDGTVRSAQPAWAEYFKANKLHKTTVQLEGGDTMRLYNATWRGGPDMPIDRPSTNAEESNNKTMKADVIDQHEELERQGVSLPEKPNLPALLPLIDEAINVQRARKPKYKVASLYAFPQEVDKNLRDGCKAYSDIRCREYSARDYETAEASGILNVRQFTRGTSRFYVFSADPSVQLAEEKAVDFLVMLTLPPSQDRHRDWLVANGFVVNGRLSWRAITKPFNEMAVVEISGRPGPWQNKARCLTCDNLQCGHATEAMHKDGIEEADPRPSGLQAKRREGAGRPPAPQRQHARTSKRMLDDGEAQVVRTAGERAEKRRCRELNQNRSISPCSPRHTPPAAGDVDEVVPAAPTPILAPRESEAAPSQRPRLEGYRVRTDLTEASACQMSLARPAAVPSSGFEVGQQLKIFSRQANTWFDGAVEEISATHRPGIEVGSVLVRFVDANNKTWGKWVAPRHLGDSLRTN